MTRRTEGIFIRPHCLLVICCFMTAGYGEIMPNSSLTLLIMALQFVTYLVMFVFMVPLALESRRNRTRHKKVPAQPLFHPCAGNASSLDAVPGSGSYCRRSRKRDDRLVVRIKQ